jgi:hypothetical protein
MCGLLVSTILADAHARSVPDIGYLRVRSPLKPITVGELAGLDLDEADQPEARQPITY